jgi:MYXO-CTERM domain-containing protein
MKGRTVQLIGVVGVGAIAAAAHANPIARWSMDPTGGPFPAVLDSRVDPGQGVLTGGSGLPAEEDHLLCFNGLGDAFTTSADVPPAQLFNTGYDGGSVSYDASAIAGVDGALFFAQDQYGQEFNLPGGFTFETFIKTNGDQSGAGNMQIFLHGENDLSWAVIANEAGPGSLRFAIQSNTNAIDVLDLAADNYADGQWHYIKAIYDPFAGEYSMLVASEDGSVDTISKPLPGGWTGLKSVGGNGFIGRNTFPLGADPRTFLGLMDEMQISAGTVSPSDMLGVPAPGAAALLGVAGIAAARRRR